MVHLRLKHSSLRSFGSRNQTRPLGLNTRKILITTTSPERDGNTPFSFSDLVTNLWWVLEGRRWNVRLQWHGYKSSKRHCCLLGASSQSDKQPEKHLTLSVTSCLVGLCCQIKTEKLFFFGGSAEDLRPQYASNKVLTRSSNSVWKPRFLGLQLTDILASLSCFLSTFFTCERAGATL